MYWWIGNIAQVRRECIRAYRPLKKGNRIKGPRESINEKTTYNERKSKLRILIKEAKE